MVGGSLKSSIDSQKFKADVEVLDLQRLQRNQDFDDEISYMFLAGKGHSKHTKKMAVIKVYDHYFKFKKTNKFEEKFKRSQFTFKEVKRIVVYEDYPKTLIVFFEDDKTGMLWYWFLRFTDIEKCSRCSQLFTDYILTLVTTRRVQKSGEKRQFAESSGRRGSRQSLYSNNNEIQDNGLDGNNSNLNGSRQLIPNGFNDADSLSLGQFAQNNGSNGLNHYPEQMYPSANLRPNYAPLFVEEYDQRGLRRVIHYSDPYNEQSNSTMHTPGSPTMMPYNEIEERPIHVASKPQIEYIEARRPKSALAGVSEKRIVYREESPKVFIVDDAPEYREHAQKVYLAKEATPSYEVINKRVEYVGQPKVKYVTQRNHHRINDDYEDSDEDHQYSRNRIITVRPRSSAGYRAADSSYTTDYDYRYDNGPKADYKFKYSYISNDAYNGRKNDNNLREDGYYSRKNDWARRYRTEDIDNTVQWRRNVNPYLNEQNRLL